MKQSEDVRALRWTAITANEVSWGVIQGVGASSGRCSDSALRTHGREAFLNSTHGYRMPQSFTPTTSKKTGTEVSSFHVFQYICTWVFDAVLGHHLRCLHPIFKYLHPSPKSASDSNFLPIRTMGASMWWMAQASGSLTAIKGTQPEFPASGLTLVQH